MANGGKRLSGKALAAGLIEIRAETSIRPAASACGSQSSGRTPGSRAADTKAAAGLPQSTLHCTDPRTSSSPR